MAAYVFRSVGAIDYDTSASNALTPGAPAGKATGDLLLLYTLTRVSAQTVTATGWTQLMFDNASSPSFSIGVYGRIADGAAADTPTVQWTGTTADAAAWIEAYSGDVYTDLATIVAHSVEDDTNELSLIQIPHLTITTADTLVVAVGARLKTTVSNDATTITVTDGLTKRLQHIQAGNGAMMLASGSLQQTTATDHTGTDWTRNGTDESQASIGLVLSLKSELAVGGSKLFGKFGGKFKGKI